jgi:hypothetical protein
MCEETSEAGSEEAEGNYGDDHARAQALAPAHLVHSFDKPQRKTEKNSDEKGKRKKGGDGAA